MPPTHAAEMVPFNPLVGEFRVLRLLGQGGMGAVYEVVHLETQRRRALKVMLPDLVAHPELRARFQLEATVAANVHSDHIVEVFDVSGEDAADRWLVVELVRGTSLRRWLDEKLLAPAMARAG